MPSIDIMDQIRIWALKPFGKIDKQKERKKERKASSCSAFYVFSLVQKKPPWSVSTVSVSKHRGGPQFLSREE